jgi:hypothetical protein
VKRREKCIEEFSEVEKGVRGKVESDISLCTEGKYFLAFLSEYNRGRDRWALTLGTKLQPPTLTSGLFLHKGTFKHE